MDDRRIVISGLGSRIQPSLQAPVGLIAGAEASMEGGAARDPVVAGRASTTPVDDNAREGGELHGASSQISVGHPPMREAWSAQSTQC
jgi:hypothetical protein